MPAAAALVVARKRRRLMPVLVKEEVCAFINSG